MKEEQKNDRGFVVSFDLNGKEYLGIFTKEGVTRAGHVHPYSQTNYLIEGKMIVYYEEYLQNYEAPCVIQIGPNIFHKFFATADSMMIERKNL
jgi:quercetin dioxygenase-like cupin family protein